MAKEYNGIAMEGNVDSGIDHSTTFFNDRKALYDHCLNSPFSAVVSFWFDERRPASELTELAGEFE